MALGAIMLLVGILSALFLGIYPSTAAGTVQQPATNQAKEEEVCVGGGRFAA